MWRVLFLVLGLVALAAAASAQDSLSRDEIKAVQQVLGQQGYDPGPADGIFGQRSVAALKRYQADHELPVTGLLTQEVVNSLTSKPVKEPPRWQKTTNQDCDVWNADPQPQETVTWSGACVNGKASGEGRQVWRYKAEGAWKTTSYEGELLDGKLHGRGVYVGANGDRYEGDFKDDTRTGRGVYVGANGNRYEGDWKDDKANGRGVYVGADGDRYEGDFKDGKASGFGDYLSADGQTYIGTWTNGCFSEGDRKAAVGVESSQCGF